jgi:hypothetical protein
MNKKEERETKNYCRTTISSVFPISTRREINKDKKRTTTAKILIAAIKYPLLLRKI